MAYLPSYAPCMYNATMKMKLPENILEKFRAAGRRGAKAGASAGGKAAALAMTDEEKSERGRAGARKRAENRLKKQKSAKGT